DDDLLLPSGLSRVRSELASAERVPGGVREPDAARERRALHAPVALCLAGGDGVPHRIPSRLLVEGLFYAARSSIDWANCSTARRVSTRWLAAMSDGSM